MFQIGFRLLCEQVKKVSFQSIIKAFLSRFSDSFENPDAGMRMTMFTVHPLCKIHTSVPVQMACSNDCSTQGLPFSKIQKFANHKESRLLERPERLHHHHCLFQADAKLRGSKRPRLNVQGVQAGLITFLFLVQSENKFQNEVY